MLFFKLVHIYYGHAGLGFGVGLLEIYGVCVLLCSYIEIYSERKQNWFNSLFLKTKQSQIFTFSIAWINLRAQRESGSLFWTVFMLLRVTGELILILSDYLHLQPPTINRPYLPPSWDQTLFFFSMFYSGLGPPCTGLFRLLFGMCTAVGQDPAAQWFPFHCKLGIVWSFAQERALSAQYT